MSIFVETLGCKVNLYESEQIAYRLESASTDESQNVCVINTCTVTQEADRQSRQAIRRAIRDNPRSLIVVTGCYAEMQPETCADIPGVDLVVPGSRKLEIPELVADRIKMEQAPAVLPASPIHALPSPMSSGFTDRTRVFVQIQQGCDNGCTFCIIHRARGSSQSVLPTTVSRQVDAFVRQGFAEIVLCGIDLGAYGLDFDGGCEHRITLASLVQQLASRHPGLRLRISSIDPAHIDDELISAMREHDNVCPHIHLSLQSAAPIILKRMKRRYTKDQVYHAVSELKSALPDLVLSADVMAGFPTESESDFDHTAAAIRELEIAYPHVFAYSERSGTPAARIPNQVPKAERKSRAARLRAIGHEVRSAVLNRYVGKNAQVLIEGRCDASPDLVRARMKNYLPVYVPSKNLEAGTVKQFRLTGTVNDGLRGEAL